MLGAMGIRLEVDDVHRFPSVRQFFSYCRVVPGADNSGGRRRHKCSKEGNRYLKLTFSHAAVRAIQNYPTIRSFYQRQSRKKNRFIARAIVAKEAVSDRLLHAFAASRVRRHLQGQTALEVEEDQVVTSGKPRNRVGLPQFPGRSVASSTEELIGKPGVVPGSYLGPLR